MSDRVKTVEELVELLTKYAEDCSDPDSCGNCTVSCFCESGWTPAEIKQLIEQLAWRACAGCGVCMEETTKNPLDCEIIGTEVEAV